MSEKVGDEKSEKSQIAEIKTFVTEEGMRVTAFCPFNKEIYDYSLKDALFYGWVGIETSEGPMEFDFEFPSDYTLEKCFENFEEIAKKRIEEKRKEIIESNLIITPDANLK